MLLQAKSASSDTLWQHGTSGTPASFSALIVPAIPTAALSLTAAYQLCSARGTLTKRLLTAKGMQAPPEVLDWLRAIGFQQSVIARITDGRYSLSPTLADMQASIAAMRELLHMSDAQVCQKS